MKKELDHSNPEQQNPFNTKVIDLGIFYPDSSPPIPYVSTQDKGENSPTGQFPLIPGQRFQIGEEIKVTPKIENGGHRIIYELSKIQPTK